MNYLTVNGTRVRAKDCGVEAEDSTAQLAEFIHIILKYGHIQGEISRCLSWEKHFEKNSVKLECCLLCERV